MGGRGLYGFIVNFLEILQMNKIEESLKISQHLQG